jgi:hypothetical protein
MITKNGNNDNNQLIYIKNQQKTHYNILSLSSGTILLSFDIVYFVEKYFEKSPKSRQYKYVKVKCAFFFG